MTLLQLHEIVQQRLSNVGVFAYSDNRHTEVDRAIQEAIFKWVEVRVKPKPRTEPGVEDYLVVTDDLKWLKNTDESLSLTQQTETTTATLPVAYYHIIKATGTVQISCYENGVLVQKSKDRPIIIVDNEHLDVLKEDTYYKSSKNKLLAQLNSANIVVQKDTTFNITAVKLTYYRQPATINFATGSGTTLEFPDYVATDIGRLAALSLSISGEQSQQKIVNMSQDGIRG